MVLLVSVGLPHIPTVSCRLALPIFVGLIHMSGALSGINGLALLYPAQIQREGKYTPPFSGRCCSDTLQGHGCQEWWGMCSFL